MAMRHSKISTFAVTVIALSLGGVTATAAELKVSGAAAIANTIVVPNKAAIEAETGLTLAVTVNGDANGLKDLYGGKSDVMMVAAPLKATEDSINKAAPGSVSATGLQMSQVGTIAIRFIINPANPVKSLSEAQVKDILTGKITNWKEVGGPDQPVLVVAEVPGFGTRTNVVTTFLGGTEISDKARMVQALVQVAQVVGQAPWAIGYGNAGSITPAVTVLPNHEVKQPIGFATKGAPSSDAKKLIDAAAKYSASVK
ncbi:putative ABC-type phosphate transport system periplasmic component-like protein [Candidatus Terasakiella magnetica]|nr:putative ABC-type phosphate transport system periplasmic component-like protein [Candidatus Terasakiella magnetica]